MIEHLEEHLCAYDLPSIVSSKRALASSYLHLDLSFSRELLNVMIAPISIVDRRPSCQQHARKICPAGS